MFDSGALERRCASNDGGPRADRRSSYTSSSEQMLLAGAETCGLQEAAIGLRFGGELGTPRISIRVPPSVQNAYRVEPVAGLSHASLTNSTVAVTVDP
jgi:hypothetical protein